MIRRQLERGGCRLGTQAILAVAVPPFLLRRRHQFEDHGQPGLAAEAPIVAFCAVPDGGEGTFDYDQAAHFYRPERADLMSGYASSVPLESRGVQRSGS